MKVFANKIVESFDAIVEYSHIFKSSVNKKRRFLPFCVVISVNFELIFELTFFQVFWRLAESSLVSTEKVPATCEINR